MQLAGVVSDLVDLIELFVRALENHGGDGLGGHRGGRESKVTSMGEVGPDRGFLAVGRQKRLTRKASTGGIASKTRWRMRAVLSGDRGVNRGHNCQKAPRNAKE